MSIPDLINGAFETLGSGFLLLSVLKLHREKMVRGIDWRQTAFFMSWGAWNTFFYAHLDQWMSWAGGLAMFVANIIWLGQQLYYVRKETQRAEP